MGKAAPLKEDFEGSFGAFCKVVRPHKDINPGYIAHYFRTPTYRRKISKLATGININNLRNEHIDNLEIPLPPLDEQRRIVAILDQAYDLRRARRRSIERLNKLSQSIFYQMFGSIKANPHNWPDSNLGELIYKDDKINYGVVQPGEDFSGGVPLVRVGDLLAPVIEPEKIKRIDPEIEKKYDRSRLKGDEILVACVGSIGVIALATHRIKDANIARAVARIRIDPKKGDRLFVAEMLKATDVQQYFQSETRTVAQPTLNIKQLVSTPIFLPPKELQSEFGRRMAILGRIKFAYAAYGEKFDELFSCLEQSAYHGEL